MGQKKRNQKQRQKAKAESGDQPSEASNEQSASVLGATGQSSEQTGRPSVLSATGHLDDKNDIPAANENIGIVPVDRSDSSEIEARFVCVEGQGAYITAVKSEGQLEQTQYEEFSQGSDANTFEMQTNDGQNSSDESASSAQAELDHQWPSLQPNLSIISDTGARPKTCDTSVWKMKGNRKIEVNIHGMSNVQIGDGQNIVQMHPSQRYADPAVTQPVSIVIQEKATISSSKMAIMNQFRDSMKQFKTGHFILITDEIEFVNNIDCLGFVKWLAVFDFDKRGWETGLLSRIKSKLQQNAFLNHVCWLDTKFSISDEKVTWISLTGISNRPDTVLDDDFNKWKRKVKANLTQQMNQIKKFTEVCTTLSVLVIWPECATKCGHIRVVIETMTETLDDVDVIVAVTSNHPNPDESNLTLLKEYYTILPIDLQDICKVILAQCSTKALNTPTLNTLPTSDGFNCPFITIEEANWLREDLDVLYLDNKEDYDFEQLQKEEQIFHKGGTLSWSARYAGRSTHADIERDNHKSVVNRIKLRHIQVCKSGIIQLCHNPGSGGTTLAQRIVWDLKEETPCVQVKHRFGSSVQDICHKIQHLHDKTHLPILALLDGEEEQRVESILRSLRDSVCIIVLYVQRYWPYIEKNNELIKNNSKTLFFLQNHVSLHEAKLFERQHRQSQTLSKEQESNLRKVMLKYPTDKVSVFEFGLAVHSYHYNGLSKYVAGYLQLDRKKNQLQSLHKALSYLSLVYFFGQSSLPCRLFADLPGMEHIYTIDDFPVEMHGIVVRDTNDMKPSMVRISHYLVAKEILNQLLPFPKQTEEYISPVLSKDAKRNLEKFSVEFIKFASRRSSDEHSSNMAYIMTKTFITRNNKQVGETEESKKKKPQLSPLLEQASTQPPFEERFRIYLQLTMSFPKEAQFKAHLGRLYSICRPEKEDLAEEHLSKALEDSLAEIRNSVEDDISNTKKLELMHIYHMYGSMIKRKLSKYTGRTHGESKRVTDFENVSKLLINNIQRACTYFTECRKMTPLGCEQCFGYVSEILVRLMFCEFINTNSGYKSVLEFLDKNENEAADFVRDSCIVMDELFVECFSVIEPELMDDSIGNCQEWYSALFRRIPGHLIPNIGDSVQSRRLEIARIKMKYSEPNKYGFLELITDAGDIHQIADRYETIIEEYENQDVPSVSKRQINMDYMEWMYVIRHKHYTKQLQIEHVLQKVELWHEKVPSPQSRFYLFVLKSLLGFGTDGDGSHSLLIEAKTLKDEVLKFSRHVTKPKYPREWLGLPRDDIRRLFPGLRFFGQIEGRDITNDEHLEIRKGTILPPNDKPSSGYIDLDLGPNNRVSISVFYVPARTKDLKGPFNKGARVEFVLGFSLLHGYEAFNVKRIATVICPVCNIAIERRSTDKRVACPKCERVFSLRRPKYP